MRHFTLLLPLAILFAGCVQTDSVLLQQGGDYSPSDGVELLLSEEQARENLEPIAIIEADGSRYNNRTDLLKALRNQAQEIGAHAVYVISSEEQYIPTVYTQNVDGSLLTIPGGYESSMLGIALRNPSQEEGQSDFSSQQIGSTRTVRGGININVVPLALGGYGLSGWAGANSFRVNVEYFTLDTPEALVRDEFTDGRTEGAFRIEGNYFPSGDLDGFYLGTGIVWMENSVGVENSSARGQWESAGFNFSAGYKFYIYNNLHIDTKASIDFTPYQDDEITVGGRGFQPDVMSPYGVLGIGVNF